MSDRVVFRIIRGLTDDDTRAKLAWYWERDGGVVGLPLRILLNNGRVAWLPYPYDLRDVWMDETKVMEFTDAP